MALKIILTEDATQTFYDEERKESYHSLRGAQSETQYVYIQMGIEKWMESNPSGTIKILEVGLGMGLTVWMSCQWAKKAKREVEYTALEPFPIDCEALQILKLFQEDALFRQIHRCEWNSKTALNPYFYFTKVKQKIEDFSTEHTYDIVFFDAFAPNKQPEIWAIQNLEKCYRILVNGGLLTTYCAQGAFKRNLKTVGFTIETPKGALGKKEMVRARK